MSVENCTTVKKGQFPALKTPDATSWSIVDFREISNHCEREDLIYFGSFKDYHLIYWKYSSADDTDTEHRFAVLKGNFTPSNPFEYASERTGANGSEQRIFK